MEDKLFEVIKAQAELIEKIRSEMEMYKRWYHEKCKEPARTEPADRGVVYG